MDYERELVFICSPYRGKTPEEFERNVRIATMMCEWVEAQDNSETPLAPHMICSQWLRSDDEHGDVNAMEISRSLIRVSKKMYAYAGRAPTQGMQDEVQFGSSENTPIIFLTDDDLGIGCEDEDFSWRGDMKLVWNTDIEREHDGA
jgi:hypothetical protein